MAEARRTAPTSMTPTNWPAIDLPVVREPLLVLAALIGVSSVGTLLLYFFGVAEMSYTVRVVLVPAIVVLGFLIEWARRSGRAELYDRTLAGLWAGCIATLIYDLVRVPVAMAGVPVFRAISYFGTIILGQPTPTFASEVVGWSYHLTNGIGFGLAYAAVVKKPRWWTGVIWGVTLEGAMLMTPYAEIFGYKRSQQFLAITIGAHVAYGLTLWGALRYWMGGARFGTSRKRPALRMTLACLAAPIGIAAIATDFHFRDAEVAPPSPPAYIGKHLYSTWDVLEVDRLVALWMFQRFVDPEARYYFYRPFSGPTTFGTPLDTPQAEWRRTGTMSTTELLIEHIKRTRDPRLRWLGKVTHAFEIAPIGSFDLQVNRFAGELVHARGECYPPEVTPCADRAIQWLDDWYDGRVTSDAKITP